MGNICSCLCPKRRNNAKTAYDVHEETFEMEQNIDSMNIEDNSPTITKDVTLSDEISDQARQSMEGLMTKSKQKDDQKFTKQEQKKYIQSKNKALNQKEISEESVSFSLQQQFSSSKQINQGIPLIQRQNLTEQNIVDYNQDQIDYATKKQQPAQIAEPPKQEIKKPNPNILKPKTIKKKYNPDDYRFKDEDGSFKVKKIDSIKCQQYNIDACNNSEYFIFDVTANVYIDDTNNCKIYIAPCESTIFVRNCKNLVIIAATKQFRTYECHNCVFSLLCKSQPVIQSSSNLTFVPFQIEYYQQFPQQMSSIKLDPWNNHWSQIHNFTKKQGETHHRLKRHLEGQQNLNWQKGMQQAQLQKIQPEYVPFIQGQFPLGQQNYQKLILLFNKDCSKDNDLTLKTTNGYRILKGFKGILPGFGKDERVALLLGYTSQILSRENLEQVGQLFTEKQEIEKYSGQFFVNFGDQRQK